MQYLDFIKGILLIATLITSTLVVRDEIWYRLIAWRENQVGLFMSKWMLAEVIVGYLGRDIPGDEDSRRSTMTETNLMWKMLHYKTCIGKSATTSLLLDNDDQLASATTVVMEDLKNNFPELYNRLIDLHEPILTELSVAIK